MPRKRFVWSARLLLLLLLILLFGGCGLLWHKLRSIQQERVAERVAYHARALAQTLESNIDEEVQNLSRIAQLWDFHGRIPHDEWTLNVEFALRHFKGYQSIQWMGADLRIHWLLPLAGNEAARDFQLTPTHPNYPIAMQAKASGQPQFSNSFALVQGGRGFVLYDPIYLHDKQGVARFDGFVQGVFRVEELMDELLADSADEFNVRLLERQNSIYTHTTREARDDLQQQVPLHLLNNDAFALQLSPTRELVASLDSPLPEFVLGAGLVISLLLVAALALAMENDRRARALKAGNRRLNKEMRQREEIEKVLIDSRERLQLVLDLTDSSSDGLFIIDPKSGGLLHTNRATYDSLGYDAQSFARLFSEAPEQILPGYHAWLEEVRQAQREDTSPIFQREMRRRDGSVRAAEISAQLVEVNGHEYLIGVSRDNSERLQLEAHLQRLSQQDGLTGLYNRRFFDQRLQAEWRRMCRTARPLALLLLDIDHFKAYNDALGHLAGDDALRQVGGLLQRCLQREGDVACRYGGEEFALILMDTDEAGAEHVAARLQRLIAELRIPHPDSPLGRVTVSIGLSTSRDVPDNRAETLVAQADRALYRAKRAGRNRSMRWDALDPNQCDQLPPVSS